MKIWEGRSCACLKTNTMSWRMCRSLLSPGSLAKNQRQDLKRKGRKGKPQRKSVLFFPGKHRMAIQLLCRRLGTKIVAYSLEVRFLFVALDGDRFEQECFPIHVHIKMRDFPVP